MNKKEILACVLYVIAGVCNCISSVLCFRREENADGFLYLALSGACLALAALHGRDIPNVAE